MFEGVFRSYSTVASLTSLFAGIFLLMVGQMLLGLGLSIKVPSLYGDGMSGVILSVHYLGLIVGAVRSREMIRRIGHIRTFAANATVLSAAVVFHAVVEDAYVWIALRLIFGLCFGALIAVFESWISDAAPGNSRGLIVSFYQFVAYFGQALGMFSLNFIHVDSDIVFLLSSVILSISLVPIVLTRVRAPVPEPFKPQKLSELFSISPLALTGAAGAGVLFGVLFALTSVFLVRLEYSAFDITMINVAIVLGGMAFQVPLAIIADRIDRRVMLLSIFILIALGCLGAMFRVSGDATLWELAAWFFLIGGGTAMAYPVALARAYDYLEPSEYVRAASAMVMTYSAMAFLGPLLGGFVFQAFGSGSFFLILIGFSLFLVAFTVFRMIRGESMSVEAQEEIVIAPTRLGASAGVQLDPRIEEEGEGEGDSQGEESEAMASSAAPAS